MPPAATPARPIPHAWMEVYLPGAGWVEFDPTNGIIGTERLIRVAVGRDPEQAMPIKGTFTGAADVATNSHGRRAGQDIDGGAGSPASAAAAPRGASRSTQPST